MHGRHLCSHFVTNFDLFTTRYLEKLKNHKINAYTITWLRLSLTLSVLQGVPPVPVTPLSLLRLMMAVSRAAAARLDVSPAPPATPPPHLLHQLEILVCDSSTLK